MSRGRPVFADESGVEVGGFRPGGVELDVLAVGRWLAIRRFSVLVMAREGGPDLARVVGCRAHSVHAHLPEFFDDARVNACCAGNVGFAAGFVALSHFG